MYGKKMLLLLMYGKKMLLLFTACALWLTSAPASAVTLDWLTVGNPGNACDVQSQGCFGSVANTYRISRHEVTNAQYAEFLNAKAASDTLDLYNSNMGSGFGGITRSGSSGSYTYSPIAGRENMPVNYVTFFDSARFTNWLHNGQGSGDTETGAYTLLGGTPLPSNGLELTRNAGATVFVPSEDEWYKAAYYDALTTSFFDNPAGSDTQPVCAAAGATPNTANCGAVVGDLTVVTSYTGSASPYGTLDQGGNVWEWNDSIIPSFNRGLRGGAYNYGANNQAASLRPSSGSMLEESFVGFRVATPTVVPEPSSFVLFGMIVGLSGVRFWIKKKRSAKSA